ncbi:MAG: NTP transferase domain-containing protein [Bacteroidia bacterium]|nr:NTP transferase domain-containing protein [Bacteroidia bacterium]NNF30984.1 NTP transferase domain-containing protein [Flavobacteriaceae bacterium]MBT8274946.1 NTP transferase domain-containing protein [Bacteroidia bacterium]NNJ82629.1 NTP transferase domain-containing protein [Flavobacteriaceae bacterium]NNK53129.1 NTP transferase domain-containing protein [Flavobacteriaceae bacterium]
MTKTLIILAGGTSSRMKRSESARLSDSVKHQADTISKALIPVNNRPILDYLLYNAKMAGIKNVIIVTGADNSMFKDRYGKESKGNAFHGLTISYAIQHIPAGKNKPMGTADAVHQALEQYPGVQQEFFLVCNCDNLYSVESFNTLIENNDSNAFINYDRDTLKYSAERIANFAITRVNADGYLMDIIEKPSDIDMARNKSGGDSTRVSMNLWKFYGPQFYAFLETCPVHPERDEKELPTAVLNMIKVYPRCMKAISFSEHVPDLTGKEDIAVLNDYLSTHYSHLDWTN